MIGIISNLPIHIFNINIIFAIEDISIWVIPVVSPTLPWAEHTSKKILPKVSCGNIVAISITSGIRIEGVFQALTI